MSTDALRPGTVLAGRFRVERIVGQGSMGVVLEANDLQLHGKVAVKIQAAERARSAESRERFVREARAAFRLSSEHVTRLLDVGEADDGTPFLVMEYLVGATLERILERDGPPPLDVTLDWIMQALEGVAEAHRQGFVHRDLKPENLFLCERPGRPPIVKVLDFGVVKDLVDTNAKLTRTGATMGSPAYMPPEQVRAQEIDQRADVWAMGVTLYELATGRLPFAGDSVPQTLAEILREEPPPLRALRPDAPAELEALVARALSKDRARRHANATELLEALAKVRAKLPRTSVMTKTVRLGKPWSERRPSPTGPVAPSSPRDWRGAPDDGRDDAFADTTDMRSLRQRGVELPSARPRVVFDLPGPPSGVAAAPAARAPSLLPLVGAALALAIVFGGLVGLFLRRHHPRTVPPATSAERASPPGAATSAPATRH